MTMAQRTRNRQPLRLAATTAGCAALKRGPHPAPSPAGRETVYGRPSIWLVVVLGLLAGCAAPVADLWPPGPGAGAQTIIVSVDSWHAMIAFPLADDTRGTGAVPGARFEEWGYAERGWYLEGRQGIGGVFRAMFSSSPGVVEVALADRLWAERTPDPPADTFAFSLSEAGQQRLREHLRGTIAPGSPVALVGTSRFYAARDDYYLFHTCHQYTAQALRAAGLPLTPALAISRGTFAAQLRRAEGMAGAAAVGAASPGR
jgi:Protein of unknown function (DUF2459)